MNKIGFFTMMEREIIRFITIPNNTFIPGLVSTFLYLLIFGVGLGGRLSSSGWDYLSFLIPGLIMMNVINNAYENPASSIFLGKWTQHIEDLMAAPISYTTIALGYISGGVIRGFIMGMASWIIAMPFKVVLIDNPLIFFSYILLASVLFSCFGIIIGLRAEEFSQLRTPINFILTPLTFLGGVFYSLDKIPETIALLTKINPLFYLINGTRYGMTGHAEGSILLGYIILIPTTVILFFTCVYLFRKGWRLRT